MPTQFEFNAEMILFIAEHVYSCKYGTFFFNCHQERKQRKVEEFTMSIWTEIDLRKKTDFKNPYFKHIS